MSSSHAALIVDADPKGLEALVYGFQGANWRITACPTPETASLLVKASGAEIMVIASRTEHEKAHTLIRQVRAKDTFHTLPLLVLGPEELRQPIKEHVDVDLLPLPAFVRDVLTASELLVAAGVTAAQRPGEEPCFTTPIAPLTTLSLVRTLCSLERSGQLRLERKGRHAELLFHEGELTSAQVGAGSLQGMAAVQHVLVWNDGALKLQLRPVARRGQIHQTLHEFIDEFDRFQRDFTHAMKDIGPSTTVYACSEERLQHSSNAVPAEVTPVVRLCDGQRSLADIIDESPFRVLDTVRILARLVDLAILVRRDPKPESDRAARSPLEEFWETAQIVGVASPRTSRTKNNDGAEQPTPLPVAPATAGSQATPAVVREGSNAPSAGPGHKHKKTLEIIPAIGQESIAPIGMAIPVSTSKQSITARMPILPPAPALLAGPVEQTPMATAPIANTMAGAGSGPAAPVAALRDTLHGFGSSLTGTSDSLSSSSSSSSFSPDSPEAKTASPGTQASGTIEPRQRRTQSSLRTVPTRTSVVLDLSQLEIPPAPEPAQASTSSVPSPMAPSSAVQTPVAPVLHNPAAPSAAGTPAAKITGEIQVAPSRRTSRQMPAQNRMSIELDATLTTPPEKANTPAQDSERAAPSNPLRLTGEMKISPSGKAPRGAGRPEQTPPSVELDPTLASESTTAAKDEREPVHSDRARHLTPDPRHKSGNFSSIETDFFEREAELYKDEGPESFSDLDDKRSTSRRSSGANKKFNRTNRK